MNEKVNEHTNEHTNEHANMNQNSEKKKFNKKIIKRIILGVILIIIMLLPFYCSSTSNMRVLVKDTNGKYYNAKVIIMNQKILFCFKEKKFYKKRSKAIKAKPEYSLSLVSLREVILLEIIFDEYDEEEIDTKIPKKYLGRYKIHLSGHVGSLFIKQRKNGRLYASVRFPRWAKGVYEPLKRVRIRKNRMSFTRSVQTREELKRVGSNTYFIQKFRGKFIENGAMIIGKFTNRGAEQTWEAYKMK